MKLTFEYEAEAKNESNKLTYKWSATFTEELDEEQVARLKKSYESGNYTFLDDDVDIADIFEEILSVVEELMEQDDDCGELLWIDYPVEIVKGTI